MIGLILLLIAITLMAIFCHLETLEIEDNHRRHLGIVMTISLYVINAIIIILVIFKLLQG